MMEFARDNYGKQYAPNTRETFRRQTMHQLVAAGIALYNPDDPARAVNSPKAVYQIEPDTATRPTRRCWNVRSSAVCRAGKVKQPKGLRRQGGAFLTCYTLPHSCAEWGFPGAGIPYDNVPYRRLAGYSVSLDPQIPLCCPRGSFQLFCRGWCLACYGRRSRSRARFGGLREKILARDQHRCRVCGALERLVVHHRRPRNVYAALITLCAACHARLHRLGAIHRWVPENLLELWAEQHPGVARQIQFSEIVRP